MKVTLFTLLFALSSFLLGACKHRNKGCCACSGKAIIACPVPPSNGYGYQK